jgi:hypothetical protein
MRQEHQASGPDRTPSYGHRYGQLHDTICGDESPDETFFSKISNKAKVDYIVTALRLDPRAFHLDLPLPVEDWSLSDDMGLINAGLYLSDLRRQFFARLINMKPDLKRSSAFVKHGEAEFWAHEFNGLLSKRTSGRLLPDPRVLH